MKLTPVVNFIYILQAAFVQVSFHQKVTKPNYKYRKDVLSTFIPKSLK